MSKTALEVVVSQNTKDIDDMKNGIKDVIKAIDGFRKDVSDSNGKMMDMLHQQNLLLVNSQSTNQAAIIKELTDHKAEDSKTFSSFDKKLAFYVGGGTAVMGMISVGIAIFR